MASAPPEIPQMTRMAATKGTRTTARPAVGGCHATVGVGQHRMAASHDLAGMASLDGCLAVPRQFTPPRSVWLNQDSAESTA